jgi:hypothetical protein
VAGEHDSLGTMVNIRENHWVAIAFDFEQSLIWYRDSWGRKPVDEVTSILDWWMFYHTGNKFTYQKLKILSQMDSFSCGLLGANGLGHFYLPEKYQKYFTIL